jgi:hypothetical protein
VKPKTDLMEIDGSFRELEQCFVHLSPLRRLASPASPAGETASRVRRCALQNILDKGRSSSLVIFSFDAWRMLMYCRMQFDIGKEERLWETLRHEAEIAAFRSKLEAQEVMLNHLVAQRQQCMIKVEEHDGATSICGADKLSCDETTLSALLDEGEEAMDAMRLRVEELEEEKAVLAKQLEQTKSECIMLRQQQAEATRQQPPLYEARKVRQNGTAFDTALAAQADLPSAVYAKNSAPDKESLTVKVLQEIGLLLGGL